MTRKEFKEKKIENEQKLIESFKNKSINGEQKGVFRKTSIWREFRKKFYVKETKVLKNGKKRDVPNNDILTQKPLTKTFNLHHVNLDPKKYTDLKNGVFWPLNSESHSTLHWIYSRYCKDPTFLKRLCDLVEEMYKINNGKDVKDYS